MSKVDDFVVALATPWQRQVCLSLLLDTREVASFEDHIKWGHPYFAIGGAAVLKWYCASGWINVYFFRSSELLDPTGLFTETDNLKMRTVRIDPSTALDRKAFRRLVRSAVAVSNEDRPANRAVGLHFA